MSVKIYRTTHLDTGSLENIVPEKYNEPFTIDLSQLIFITPWGAAGLASLLFDCVGKKCQFNLILPTNPGVLAYLKRAHFKTIIDELGLAVHSEELDRVEIREHEAEDTLLEIIRLRAKADYYLKASHIAHLLVLAGIDSEKASYIVGVVAEMVDNTFGHNLGNWPHPQYKGGILMAQRYRKSKELEIALSDLGVGIRNSLHANPLYADLKTDREAIMKALEKGVTARRHPQRGGNGFTFIMDTLNTAKSGLRGAVDVWSGNSHLQITDTGKKSISESKWLIGTSIALKVTY